VFRRINAIEETLGTRLFERGRAGYALTAAGEEMVALAGRMSEEITGFERRIAGRDVKPSGELRVTTNDTMMAHLMAPVVASFLSTFPDVKLDVVVSNASLNLSKRDADVAVRATISPPETLVGRRVCSVGWAVYGPVRLAGRSLEDLKDERWIGFGENLAHVAPARWMKESVAADRIVVRLNTILGFAEAAASIGCLGVVPCFIADQMPSLARLTEPDPELAAGLWLLTHPDLKQSARVRAFMDHAWEALSRRRSLLEGRGASAGSAAAEERA
jgi:DNA-binding transcriptional LysR family regulator